MNGNDERDYAEESANQSDMLSERRSESGVQVTVTAAWEEAHFETEQFAEDLRTALVKVAELATDSQMNSIVTSNIAASGEPVPAKMDDFLNRIRATLPYAQVESDNDGQLIIYTGLRQEIIGSNRFVVRAE